jgi:cobalt-zinc-cadmium efflux system membrane fusion protein
VRNRLRILGKSDKEIAALEAQPTQKLDPVTIVTAPIGGTITQRQIGLGQYVNSTAVGASGPVYTIGNLSTVWLIANVRERDAPLMQVGLPVEVRVLAFPGHVFNAKISWVAPSIDPNTHRLSVRADVENPEGELKPGMFANFPISASSPARPRPLRPCRSAQSFTRVTRPASGWRMRMGRSPDVPSALARLPTGWSRYSRACLLG